MSGRKASSEIWRTYFNPSTILNHNSRCILYFNLPFKDIISEEIKPEKIYQRSLEDATIKGIGI
jgi:hypothetical protein